MMLKEPIKWLNFDYLTSTQLTTLQNEAFPSTDYPLYVQDTFIIWST